MIGPKQPNRTGTATAADLVMTPANIAQMIVEHYNPTGLSLDPARGEGAFYNALPAEKDWCEITEGKDFFDYHKRVDWIITNPPYSIYDRFMEHCFTLADNVVLLVPIQKAFKSMKTERLVDQYGGLKEIWVIGGGSSCGFKIGFPVGCLYYKRGYKGKINRVFKQEEVKE